jgi:CheY-like chemotaxis protein
MKRVLVVDDYAHLRNTIMEILSANGYEVITAEDGEVGIELAQRYLPDLILCDVNMPEKNGYELMVALSQNPHTAHIPIVMLTGDTDKLRGNYDLKDNFKDTISKPFETMTLISTVDFYLQGV